MSDLIRREDALALRDKLADIIGALPMSSIYSALSEYRNAILALPAVQPDAREVALREALVALQGAGSFGRTAAEKHSALEQYCMCRDAILALIDKPAHVNETPKSEHDARDVLTPATKGGAA